MSEKIREVAKILLSRGVDIKEMVLEAVSKGNEYDILKSGDLTTLEIHSTLPYNLKVIDIYVYNKEGHLIKQIISLDGKEKVIFDKFEEAERLLREIDYEKRKIA